MMFKFFAAVAPAFLATAVVAYPDYPTWTTDIPVDADYVIGSEFALEWVPQDTTETFKLLIGAWNNTPSGYYTGPFGAQLPIYDSKSMYLDGKLALVPLLISLPGSLVHQSHTEYKFTMTRTI